VFCRVGLPEGLFLSSRVSMPASSAAARSAGTRASSRAATRGRGEPRRSPGLGPVDHRGGVALRIDDRSCGGEFLCGRFELAGKFLVIRAGVAGVELHEFVVHTGDNRAVNGPTVASA